MKEYVKSEGSQRRKEGMTRLVPAMSNKPGSHQSKSLGSYRLVSEPPLVRAQRGAAVGATSKGDLRLQEV